MHTLTLIRRWLLALCAQRVDAALFSGRGRRNALLRQLASDHRRHI